MNTCKTIPMNQYILTSNPKTIRIYRIVKLGDRKIKRRFQFEFKLIPCVKKNTKNRMKKRYTMENSTSSLIVLEIINV